MKAGFLTRCDVCGTEGTRVRRVTRTYGKGRDLLVRENIPAVSCPHCGASYLTAETLHQIDGIKSDRHKLALKRSVEVANFA